MARITRICRPSICKRAALALGTAALLLPSYAQALVDDRVDDYVKAWLAGASDENADAANKFLALLKKEPANEAFSKSLWDNAIRAGDKKKALRAARALELQGGVPETALLLFGDAMERRSWRDARSVVNSLSGGNNYKFLKPLFEAWIRSEQGQAHGFPLQPESQILRYYSVEQRAYLNLASGNIDQAKISLGAFASIDDEYARYLRVRAAPVLAANGEAGLARRLTRGLIPDDLAANYIDKPAQPLLKKISAADGLSALYIKLAAALLEQDLPEQALSVSRAATWLAPHNDVAKLILARTLQGLKKDSDADDTLALIKPVSPYWGRAAINRIQALLRADHPEAALAMAKEVSAQRNAAELLILLGQSQQAAGDLDAANATFTKLLNDAAKARLSPQRRAIYHLYLGTVQDKQGNWQQARETLEKGIALNPQNPYIINYLAYSLLERRQEVKPSLEMLQRAHRLAPDSAAITDSLGWGYFLTGDYPNAVRFLEKAARSAGSDVTINEHLGDAYWLSGRFVDARYAWRTASLTADGEDKPRLARKVDLGLEHSARAQ